MAINLKDIQKLQASVRTDLANGAPGRKTGFGCCAAVQDNIRQSDGPHRSASLEDRIKRFRGTQPLPKTGMSPAQFRQAAEKVMGFANPVAQTKQPKLTLKPGQGTEYTSDEIRQLIVDDINRRGIDLGIVRVTFHDQGATVQALQ